MLSKPIVAFGTNNIALIEFTAFLSIGVINLLTITANWLSSKKTEMYYNKVFFLSDIGTLAIFAVFTQIIADGFKDEKLLLAKPVWLIVFSVSYSLIYMTFLLWNFAACKIEDSYGSKILRISIVLNFIVIISLIAIALSVFLDFDTFQYHVFFLNIILQFMVLLFYYIVVILPPNKKSSLRQRAEWIGSRSRYWKQLAVSIFSYLKRPFVCEDTEAIKKYWKGYYSGVFIDDLVFDSNALTYLDKIEPLIKKIDDISKTDVIDLCSGNGNLYKWLLGNGHLFKSYLGVDFSIENICIADNAELINSNIECYNYTINDETIIFIINGLCYCDTLTLNKIFKKVLQAKAIIIVEPVPGIFWDACFQRIILHYRGKRKLSQMLKYNGFSLISCCTDYAYKFCGLYIQPLSSAYLFQKN
jgi:SAM-dependent methyltransferase